MKTISVLNGAFRREADAVLWRTMRLDLRVREQSDRKKFSQSSWQTQMLAMIFNRDLALHVRHLYLSLGWWSYPFFPRHKSDWDEKYQTTSDMLVFLSDQVASLMQRMTGLRSLSITSDCAGDNRLPFSVTGMSPSMLILARLVAGEAFSCADAVASNPPVDVSSFFHRLPRIPMFMKAKSLRSDISLDEFQSFTFPTLDSVTIGATGHASLVRGNPVARVTIQSFFGKEILQLTRELMASISPILHVSLVNLLIGPEWGVPACLFTYMIASLHQLKSLTLRQCVVTEEIQDEVIDSLHRLDDLEEIQWAECLWRNELLAGLRNSCRSLRTIVFSGPLADPDGNICASTFTCLVYARIDCRLEWVVRGAPSEAVGAISGGSNKQGSSNRLRAGGRMVGE